MSSLPTLTLTNGERLTLIRRRKSYRQCEMAEELGVSLYRYYNWELDRCDPPSRRLVPNVKDYELCWVLRRRAGLTREELTTECGLDRWAITQMERGDRDPDPLIDFWENDRSVVERKRA